jgi:hypothetical protein
MDLDTRAAIASMEVDERKVDGIVVRTVKIKFWDKNAALEKAMRHLGVYERDNTQRSENLESPGGAGGGADERARVTGAGADKIDARAIFLPVKSLLVLGHEIAREDAQRRGVRVRVSAPTFRRGLS